MGDLLGLAATIGVTFIMGCFAVVQTGCNVTLGDILGQGLRSAFFYFLSATVLLTPFALGGPSKADTIRGVLSAPRWAWLGGLAAALYIVASILITPVLGLSPFYISVVLGQLLSATMLSSIGMTNAAPRSPMTLGKLIGLALAVAATVLIRFGNVGNGHSSGVVAGVTILSILAGALLPLQAGLDRSLASYLGTFFRASLASFGAATVLLGLASLLTLAARDAELDMQPDQWWAWMGGLIGVCFVHAGAVFPHVIGTSAFYLAFLAGQLGCALYIDHMGAFSFEAQDMTVLRGFAAVLAWVAAYFIAFSRSSTQQLLFATAKDVSAASSTQQRDVSGHHSHDEDDGGAGQGAGAALGGDRPKAKSPFPGGTTVEETFVGGPIEWLTTPGLLASPSQEDIDEIGLFRIEEAPKIPVLRPTEAGTIVVDIPPPTDGSITSNSDRDGIISHQSSVSSTAAAKAASGKHNKPGVQATAIGAPSLLSLIQAQYARMEELEDDSKDSPSKGNENANGPARERYGRSLNNRAWQMPTIPQEGTDSEPASAPARSKPSSYAELAQKRSAKASPRTPRTQTRTPAALNSEDGSVPSDEELSVHTPEANSPTTSPMMHASSAAPPGTLGALLLPGPATSSKDQLLDPTHDESGSVENHPPHATSYLRPPRPLADPASADALHFATPTISSIREHDPPVFASATIEYVKPSVSSAVAVVKTGAATTTTAGQLRPASAVKGQPALVTSPAEPVAPVVTKLPVVATAAVGAAAVLKEGTIPARDTPHPTSGKGGAPDRESRLGKANGSTVSASKGAPAATGAAAAAQGKLVQSAATTTEFEVRVRLLDDATGGLVDVPLGFVLAKNRETLTALRSMLMKHLKHLPRRFAFLTLPKRSIPVGLRQEDKRTVADVQNGNAIVIMPLALLNAQARGTDLTPRTKARTRGRPIEVDKAGDGSFMSPRYELSERGTEDDTTSYDLDE